MSTEQEEERKEVVEREPVEGSIPSTVTSERVVREPEPLASERKESVIRRKNTNVGAIIAMAVGIVILFVGVYLILAKLLPYLPYPWSEVAILIVALVFIVVGASLLVPRTTSL